MAEKIKVLVVDDSALVRKIITDILESDPMIEVVGTANNGKSAIFKNHTLEPDVITLDIEMPIMDGLQALQEIIRTRPRPVIMMSVLTQHGADATFKALEYGAVDFIPKPSSVLSLSVEDIADLLITKIKAVHRSDIKFHVKEEDYREPPTEMTVFDPVSETRAAPVTVEKRESARIVGLGTSTGGPSALLKVFQSLPGGLPVPIMVVQHMPAGFTSAFAERLNNTCPINIKEAADGDELWPGWGYIAPGDKHMVVENKGKKKVIRISEDDKVSGHRPSIDVLFNSMAEISSSDALGVIMTGMGKDGSQGILQIFKKGGYTLAQNEETSVVYGMNRVAVELGGVREIVSLSDMSQRIVDNL